MDHNGLIIVSSDRKTVDGFDPNPEVSSILAGDQRGFYTEKTGPDAALSLLGPKIDDATRKPLGGVKYTVATDDIHAAVARLVHMLLLAGLAITTAFAAAFLLLFHRVSHTFAELRQGIGLVANGNHAVALQVRESVDADEVLHGFNLMAEALKKRADRSVQLFEKVKSIAVAHSFEVLFERLAEALKQEIDAAAFLVLIIRDNDLVVSHSTGYGEDLVFQDETYPISEDVFTEIVEYGKPLTITDPTEINNCARYRDLLARSGPVMLLPISRENEIYGIIHVAGMQRARPFSSDDAHAGGLIAGGAAVALSHISGLDSASAHRELKTAPFKKSIQCSAGPLRIYAMSLGKHETVEFFELPDIKRQRSTLICVQVDKSFNPPQVFERMRGLVQTMAHLQETLTNLSFFSVSMLAKMPPSDQREAFLKQFRKNPFAPEELAKTISTLFPETNRGMLFEIFRFDGKKLSCNARLSGLNLFRVSAAMAFERTEVPPVALSAGPLVGLPGGLFSASDLATIDASASREVFCDAIATRYTEKIKEYRGPACFPVLVMVQDTST